MKYTCRLDSCPFHVTQLLLKYAGVADLQDWSHDGSPSRVLRKEVRDVGNPALVNPAAWVAGSDDCNGG